MGNSMAFLPNLTYCFKIQKSKMIQAKVIADSKNKQGDRITTMIVTMPRIVLAEFNTHRMFSRNSASSRAIPFKKMVDAVKNNPFIPIAWQKDHKGMQGTEYFTDSADIEDCVFEWLRARDKAVEHAETLNEDYGDGGVTKQLCNRLLEPFMYHTVICTSVEWENFFYLRCPQYHTKFGVFRSIKDAREAEVDITNRNPNTDVLETPSKDDVLGCLSINKSQAEIHIQAVAEAMWDALNESTPKELQASEWHIPFGDNIDLAKLNYDYLVENIGKEDELLIKIATARCARVSYTVVGEEGKEPNYENDVKLHDRLAESGHWSPFEHCARAMSEREYEAASVICLDNEITEELPNYSLGWSGNFKGFIQYRKTFKGENKV